MNGWKFLLEKRVLKKVRKLNNDNALSIPHRLSIQYRILIYFSILHTNSFVSHPPCGESRSEDECRCRNSPKIHPRLHQVYTMQFLHLIHCCQNLITAEIKRQPLHAVPGCYRSEERRV